MRQFSPFQKVTKIPLLFSAQTHSVPPQTTSRGDRQPWEQTLSCSELLRGERGCSDVVPLSVTFGTAGRAALSALKSMECQSQCSRSTVHQGIICISKELKKKTIQKCVLRNTWFSAPCSLPTCKPTKCICERKGLVKDSLSQPDIWVSNFPLKINQQIVSLLFMSTA